MDRTVPGTARSHAGLLFMTQFLKAPGQVGAIAPSSRYLADRMLETIDFDRVEAIAEYGPGAGAVTRRIISRLRPQTRFFALEFNEGMAKELGHRFPAIKVHVRSAADIGKVCVEEGLPATGGLDVVVSGLPWASFDEALQKSILEATVAALKPGGRLMTFAYYQGLVLPAGRRFASSLPRYFSRIERSRGVFRNVPPAFVYRCTK